MLAQAEAFLLLLLLLPLLLLPLLLLLLSCKLRCPLCAWAP
jgi:hypothetical protein